MWVSEIRMKIEKAKDTQECLEKRETWEIKKALHCRYNRN